MISTQFLQSCQAGDEEAIETLVRTHQRAVFQLALSVIDDAPEPAAQPDGAPAVEAEKATRETFVVALKRLGRFREDNRFEPWLYAIAVEVSRKRYRRLRLVRWLRRLLGKANQANAWETAPDNAADPRAQPGDADLWAAVRGLKEGQRLAVVLRYYHELPIEDIAQVLHISQGAVHARLDAAREKIARALETPQPPV